jgi:hypothetical protein
MLCKISKRIRTCQTLYKKLWYTSLAGLLLKRVLVFIGILIHLL